MANETMTRDELTKAITAVLLRRAVNWLNTKGREPAHQSAADALEDSVRAYLVQMESQNV